MRESFKRIDISYRGKYQGAVDEKDYQESMHQREVDAQNIAKALLKTFPKLSLENTIDVEITIATNDKKSISSLSERHQRRVTSIDFCITIPRRKNFKPSKRTTEKFLSEISALYPFILRESICGSIEEILTCTFVALK